MSKVAIFFDAQNVTEDISVNVPKILNEANRQGDVLYQRAYADWSQDNMSPWGEQLRRTPIVAIQQFILKSGDQSTDKLIMMDAIQMAIEHPEIDKFIIVAHDTGYYQLALRLRELGKRVIGIGNKIEGNNVWISACNEFKYIKDLDSVGELADDEEINCTNISEEEKKIVKDHNLEIFLEKAFDSTQKYKDTEKVLMSRFWESVLRLKSDFSYKDYTYEDGTKIKSSRDLVKCFPEIFELTVGEDHQTYYVSKIEKKSFGRLTGKVVKYVGATRFIEADNGKGEFFLHISQVNEEFSNEKFKEGTLVDFEVEQMPDPASPEKNKQRGRAIDAKII